ncbi:MAG TPA: glycosyltransferase [Leptolyngbyaceae cyanobacterium M65_K2018_010]|nr:glycosyltransferase [Leptolyngbyaceae cyanobacterium M65_K2018_010]
MLFYVGNLGFCGYGFLHARDFDYLTHKKNRNKYNIKELPSVDIFLPSCGENIRLLVHTFDAIRKIKYNKLNVYCLDDEGRDSLRILSKMNGFHYISRPNRGELKKAGNLRYAFSRTRGDLILVLDADFAPRADFLMETTFKFLENKKLGILQTPQYFEIFPGQSYIAKGATVLQETFYRGIQSFRNIWKASVCCGSCALYRRAALAPHGGPAKVERSEDVNTGLMLLRDGWEIEYVPLILAAGLSPDNLITFFNQQYRWCVGSLHLITRKIFWVGPINLKMKLSYCLSIFYYITSGIGLLFFPMPSLINIWYFPENLLFSNYCLIAPTLLMLVVAKSTWSKSEYGFYVLRTALAASYVHLIAILDFLRGNMAPWIPTGTKVESSRYKVYTFFRFFIPIGYLFLFLVGLCRSYEKIEIVSIFFPLALISFHATISITLSKR